MSVYDACVNHVVWGEKHDIHNIDVFAEKARN